MVAEIVTEIVTGMTTYLSGIGAGLVGFVDSVAYTGTGATKTMTTLFAVLLATVAIAISGGLLFWGLSKLTMGR